jgi:hypothetical protein
MHDIVINIVTFVTELNINMLIPIIGIGVLVSGLNLFKVNKKGGIKETRLKVDFSRKETRGARNRIRKNKTKNRLIKK